MSFEGLAAHLAHVRAEIARYQARGGWSQPVTIVAVTKGFGAEAVQAALARHIAAEGALALEGLMTLAPLTDDTDVQRRAFRGLRALRDQLQEEGVWVPTLSMGMSADYATAVEEGATVIRLGTILFGARTA